MEGFFAVDHYSKHMRLGLAHYARFSGTGGNSMHPTRPGAK